VLSLTPDEQLSEHIRKYRIKVKTALLVGLAVLLVLLSVVIGVGWSPRYLAGIGDGTHIKAWDSVLMISVTLLLLVYFLYVGVYTSR